MDGNAVRYARRDAASAMAQRRSVVRPAHVDVEDDADGDANDVVVACITACARSYNVLRRSLLVFT